MRWMVVVILVLAAHVSGERLDEDARPNIVLIVADDLRWDAIGYWAGRDLHTPHLDRLYAAGYRFSNTYAIGSNSGAVCAPSRAMLMTGQSLQRFWRSTKIDGEPTLPSFLRASGYRTFGTGKWHQSRVAFTEGFDEGSSIFFGGCIACSATSNTHNEKAKQASYSVVLRRKTRDAEDGVAYEPDEQSGIHVTDRFADAACSFLESSHDAERPTFTYVSFTAPHDPRVAPPEFDALFRDDDGTPTVERPVNFMRELPFDQGDARIRDEILIDIPRDGAALDEEIADYRAMVAHMDAAIGRVLDAAQAADTGRGTMVCFTSDHGLALGSHGLMGKQNPYEHSIRAAPLVIAGAGVPRGESSSFAILNDVMPTLLSLVDVDVPAQCAGKSLVPVMRGARDAVRTSVTFAYKDYSRSVRVGDWKLVYFPHLDLTQLFNLASDPDEMHDRSGDSDHQALMERLRGQLAR